MTRPANFADPTYEPTDEDLAALVHEAFAGIGAAREESLRAMRARIREAQDEVRRRLRDGSSAAGR